MPSVGSIHVSASHVHEITTISGIYVLGRYDFRTAQNQKVDAWIWWSSYSFLVLHVLTTYVALASIQMQRLHTRQTVPTVLVGVNPKQCESQSYTVCSASNENVNTSINFLSNKCRDYWLLPCSLINGLLIIIVMPSASASTDGHSDRHAV